MNLQAKGALKTLGLLGVLMVCIWAWVSVRLGVWDLRGYVHALQCIIGIQPLGFYLWRGDIKPGDDMEKLLESVRPTCTTHYGEWTEYYFMPGCNRVDMGPRFGEQIIMITRGNSIVRAEYGGCTFDRQFFNSLNETDEAERQRAFEEYARQLQERKKGRAQPAVGG